MILLYDFMVSILEIIFVIIIVIFLIFKVFRTNTDKDEDFRIVADESEKQFLGKS